MDYRPAEFVRFVLPDEAVEDVIEEAKAETWTKEREHALLVVSRANGEEQFAIVRGGRDGILLERADDRSIGIQVEKERFLVRRLAWHVHPMPTGPSDHDFAVLDALTQESSMLFEIGGPRGGTLFSRKSGRKT